MATTSAKSKGSQICLPTDDAAKVFDVSASSIKPAKHVADKGDKTVVDAVKSGAITVSAAAKLVDTVPNKNRQRKIVKLARNAIIRAGKKAIVAAKVEPYREEQEPEADEPAHEPVIGTLPPSEETPAQRLSNAHGT